MFPKVVKLSCHLSEFLYDFLKTVCKLTLHLISLVLLSERFVQVSSPINLDIIILIFLLSDNSQEASIFHFIISIHPIVRGIMEVFNKQSTTVKLVVLLFNRAKHNRISIFVTKWQSKKGEKQLSLKANFPFASKCWQFKGYSFPLVWAIRTDPRLVPFTLQCSTAEFFLSLSSLNLYFVFAQQQKKTKLKNYKAVFPSEVLKVNVLDIFCCRVVENTGILLSRCCFCVPSSSHGHVGLSPVRNSIVICVFELFIWTSDTCACRTASAETLEAAASRTTLFSTIAFRLVSSEEMDSKDIQGRKVQVFGCFVIDNSQRNCRF